MHTSVTGSHGTYLVDTSHVAKGGIGSIHLTTDAGLVYKKYHDPAKAPDRTNLRHLVRIGRDVVVDRGVTPGTTPEASINWPIDVVTGPSGAIQGVILPAIPPALFNTNSAPRGLDFLIMRRAQPPLAKARVALLLRMAEILAYLDAGKLVHGDVNYKNLVWTAVPAPTAYLIDCDGLVPQIPPPAVGVYALGWSDPRLIDQLIPAHDHLSDWYALALAIYRGLTLEPGNLTAKDPNGAWPKPSRIPPQLDPTVAALLHQALDDPLNANRPSPVQWVQALTAAYLPGGAYDNAALDALDATPQPAAMNTFIPLPHTNWTRTTGINTLPPNTWQIAQMGGPSYPGGPVPIPSPPRSSRRRRKLAALAICAITVAALIAWSVSQAAPAADPDVAAHQTLAATPSLTAPATATTESPAPADQGPSATAVPTRTSTDGGSVPEPVGPSTTKPASPTATTLTVTALLNDLTGGYPINLNPIHTNRPMRVVVLDSGGNVVFNTQQTATHIPGASSYTATFSINGPWSSGAYDIKAKLDYTLYGVASASIAAGAAVSVPGIGVVVGDVNQDGAVNQADYDLITNCYGDFGQPPPGPCDSSQQRAADLDDDGSVTLFDLNLYLRQVQHL